MWLFGESLGKQRDEPSKIEKDALLDGTILHLDGADREEQWRYCGAVPKDVFALDEKHLWAVCFHKKEGGLMASSLPLLLFFDGMAWAELKLPAIESPKGYYAGMFEGLLELAKVQAIPKDDVLVLGQNPERMLRHGGKEWSGERDLKGYIRDFTVAGRDDIWIMGGHVIISGRLPEKK